MNDATMEQLMQLKAMTIRTNVIHEAQRLQLELWPRMSLQISECKPKVSFEDKTIVLDCKSPKKFKEGKFEKELFKNILTWVRTILWDETRVVITINKARVFDSATN